MKFNKVIREYLNEQLTDKMNAARENNPVRVSYEAKQKEAKQELEAIKAQFNEQVTAVLKKYGMDTNVMRWGEEMSAAEAIFGMDTAYIRQQQTREAIDKYDRALYQKKEDIAKQIELDCALGADKDEFMRMLAEVQF